MHSPSLIAITFACLAYVSNAANFNGHLIKRQGAASCKATAKMLTLPKLDYDYNALEPAISEQIMTLHHSKHLQAYVDGYNAAEQQLAQAVNDGDVLKQVQLIKALNFNSGGYLNHDLFFKNLASPKSKDVTLSPDSKLAKAINDDFTSFQTMVDLMTKACLSAKGSAWVWLGYNTVLKRLEISTSKDQDTLTTLVPIIAIDVWEHAYYLQYFNVRADYVKAIWTVINFTVASQRFEAALQT